ncbi:hypothetical protein [Paenibacillus sp. QZ-Y1]|uniref:hypothetical protein n=1 Tax=Paenibacillus sp. QZ-Y1 TaxID=3414511 RepID=UPI003F7B1800
MKQSRSFIMSISLIIMVLALAACSGGNEPSASPEPSTPTGESAPAPSTENEQASETNETNETERPQTKSFEMLTAEGNQSLTATLQQGEGFSLYVFEKFTFDAAQGCLFLSSNPEYYVDIEPLPSDYNLAELKTAGKAELEKFGEVSDYSGELVEHPLGFAELYLQSSSGEGISDFMIWKSKEGDAFLFRLHNPKGEEASDFASPVWVSLSTVQSDS